jgi:hypothetical protein
LPDGDDRANLAVTLKEARAMRAVLFLAAVAIATAAHAQSSRFYAERGYWLVASGLKFCRALNRPAADFNFAPYNALEIAAGPDNTIAAEVYFWPKAIDPAREYVLKLTFEQAGADTLSLKAKSTMGDFMLALEPELKLWRNLQDAKGLTVAVEGEPDLKLYFSLNDILWVLNMLQSCISHLPKE